MDTTAITAENAEREIARRKAPGRKGSARRASRIARAKREGTFTLGGYELWEAASGFGYDASPLYLTAEVREDTTTLAATEVDDLAREFAHEMAALLMANRELFV